MTPFAVQAAVAAELIEGGLKDALQGAGRAIDEIGQLDGKALSSFGDQSAKLDEAVQKLQQETRSTLNKIQGSFKKGVLDKNQAEAAINAITEQIQKETEAINKGLATGGKQALLEKLNGASRKITEARDAALISKGVTQETIDELNLATREAGSTIAGGDKPKPETDASAQRKADGVAPKDQEAVKGQQEDFAESTAQLAQKKGGAAGPEPKVENDSETGVELSPDQIAQYTEEVKENPALERNWAATSRLMKGVDELSKLKADLEKELEGSGVTVKKSEPGEPTGSATLEIKAGKYNKEQIKDLEKSMPTGQTFRDVESKDVTVIEGPPPKIQVRTEGSILEYEVSDSEITTMMLKGKNIGRWTQRFDGKMTFELKDVTLASKVGDKIDGMVQKIEGFKKDITEMETELKEVINCFRSAWRGAGKAISSKLSAAGKALKEEKLKMATNSIVGFFKGIFKIAEMMMTGVFFGVPSMIYQTLMQQAAAKALYEQISAVYYITPDFAVQIPPDLISSGNAAQAGTFLYVAISPASTGYSNNISSADLENGSYYVVYQTGAPWGSTYATSPNAFGVWVNLNTGLVFMDDGVPYSEQTPFSYLMEPSNDSTIQATKGSQATLSVQGYTLQAYSALGNRANYSYQEGFLDAVAPWTIVSKSYDQSATPNQMIQQMFASVDSSISKGGDTTKKASRYAPKLLVRTLNKFRNGIHNVPGFLPGSKATPPAISIKQIEGTGILNRLLGSQSSPDNIHQSVELMTALSTTMSPVSKSKPSPDSTSDSEAPALLTAPAARTNVVQAVFNAQADLKQALSNENSSHYGNDVEWYSQALSTAQENLEAALDPAISSNSFGATNMGLDSSVDVNAYNVYLYETEDTPIVKFMKNNKFSHLIPAKDYVVFLDINLNIVPLFSTGVITRPDGIAVLDFDTSQINSNIQYMVSLVTGIAYLYEANGPGKIQTQLNNMPASTYIASTLMPGLFQQIALVFNSEDTQNLTNQILSMANYATNLSYQGPLLKNGCLFEKVPLELSTKDAEIIQKKNLDDALNGMVIPAQPEAHKTSFGDSVSSSIQQSQLDGMPIYKVSRVVHGSKEKVGVFGTDVDGKPIYDYVVAVAQNTDSNGHPCFQMMPLGIIEAAGDSSGMSGDQMIFSLVTGQVYDSNYCPVANATATAIERTADFSPFQALPGQSSIDSGQKDANGNEIYVAAVFDVPLSTAFMPTFCNPFNISYGSLHSSPQYVQDVAAVSAAQQVERRAQLAVNSAQIAVKDTFDVVSGDTEKAEYPQYVKFMWGEVQNDPTQKTLNEVFNSKKFAPYVPYLYLKGESKSENPLLFKKDMQAWIIAQAALASAQTALASAQKALIPLQNALRLKVQALQAVLQPPYYPVKKATNQMLIMCPMYWMHYVNFVWAAQSANAQQITYTNPSQTPVNLTINWIDSIASANTTPVGYSLGQALPITNVLDIVKAYQGWQDNMNSTNGVAKVMQSGPFQFSQNQEYNVYLTMPATNGTFDLETGNFFYSMVPVGSPTSLFVLGNLDSGVASSIQSSLATNNISGLAAPLTLDQCNSGNSLGSSYLKMLDENPVAIDISSGDVWLPTPLAYSVNCLNKAQGNIANAECNVFKIGTLDPQEVLATALKNQGTTLSNVETDNPGLYSMLMNAQALAVQKSMLALTAYFAGSELSLCQEQITNGTYIYAVNVSPANYYSATDYWVATDSNGNPQGVITPSTQYMVSLVTGNYYGMNVSGDPQTAQSVAQDFTTGTGVATIDTPLTAFKKMFCIDSYAYNKTILSSVPKNNPKLFNIIEGLNNLQYQYFVQSQVASSANSAILQGQIPLDLLQTATPVSALYNTLYLVNNKYYLAMPGTGGAPTYYYDFNAEQQDVTSSNGTVVYTPVPGDAKRGMYYEVEGTGSTAVATPVSELTGYGCQAMRMRFGIAVDKDGNETIGLPVYNPSLPMGENDVNLRPGASGENMKCLTSAANIATNAGITDSYTYYQYKNIASESYFTRCVLNTKIPVYNSVAQSFSSILEHQDYYVDLVTGECYNPDGTPRLSNITVAYDFTGTATTGIVPNSALNFSNPLFVWGELDMLGESLQAYMMYQDTNVNDPSNGYNQYQVQQYSTSFTLYDGGSLTVYAYGVDPVTGNMQQITQNGKPMTPQQTNMSTVLVNALNGGASLVSKSYTMNMNGVVPVDTPQAGATVTVTETFVAPKQYMISYTSNNLDVNDNKVPVNDMFQVPVTSGPGTAPGASTNSYSNPPLDASFQAQLLQAKPFCARVFASCPYGQETAQNINTTIATDGTAEKVLTLGTSGVTCGLLYQPVSAASFSLPSAGLLSAIFSGANPIDDTGTGATNGQYFAFYDSYNNSSNGSSNVVPNKGQYATYISVVSSMGANASACPGLYAGNFNVEFASAPVVSPAATLTSTPTSTALATTRVDPNAEVVAAIQASTSAIVAAVQANNTNQTPVTTPTPPTPYTPPVMTTYGAPYLRIMPITGTSEGQTNYTVPPALGSTEYLYKYQYDIVSNSMLATLKSTLNISGNIAGFMQLVSALDAGDLAGVTAANGSVNQAAAAVITNQIFYGKPLNALTQEPKGRYLYKLACASGGADAASTSSTNSLCQMFYTAGETNPDTYIDIYNGIVFQTKTTPTNKQVLYPIGFSITHDQSNAISQMIGGVMPDQDSAALVINTPVVSKAKTKTNPNGLPVGQGLPLPGQVFKQTDGSVTVGAYPSIPVTQ